MKKIIITIVALMTLGLTACGKNNETSDVSSSISNSVNEDILHESILEEEILTEDIIIEKTEMEILVEELNEAQKRCDYAEVERLLNAIIHLQDKNGLIIEIQHN